MTPWFSAARAKFWILALVAVPYLWFALQNYRYELDDALIYMRYIQNLVDGHGLVYNRGERFDGLTSPLFSYLTALIAVVSRNARFATWFVSAVSTYAALAVLCLVFDRQLARVRAMPRSAALLGLILAATIPYFFSTYGMETGLFALLVAATLWCYLERRWNAFYVVGAMLILTRPEGLALIGACGLHYLIRARAMPPLPLRPLLVAVGLVVCVALANTYFFGSPWPQTGAAKIWQGKSGYWGDQWIFWNVAYLEGIGFRDGWAAVIVLGAAVIGVIGLGASELNVIVLLFLLGYSAFYTIFNIPNYHWYYSAYFLFLPYYAAVGAGYLALTLVRGDPTFAARLLAAFVLCVAAYPVWPFVQADSVRKDSSGMPYARAGAWIDANTPADSSFAAAEIGALGWYSRRPVVDILGLVNAGNARRIGERDFDGWVTSYRPDYLLVHDPVNALEMAFYTLVARHALIQQCAFPVSGYLFYKIDYSGHASSFCDADLAFETIEVGATKIFARQDLGHIDSVAAVGNFVRIVGWATDGAGGAYASLAVDHRGGVEFGVNRRYKRPDVGRAFHNAGYDTSGYDLVLRFASAAQAAEWAAHPCLTTISRGHAVPLHDVDRKACGLSEDEQFADGFD
jgi:hypothetical protein